ncbi:MAG TPA: hypothetical protein VHT24_10785 [Pseudacidobacterium sp.]|jgi:hypothetical protein|nr:hypothetical protein [Pseudacidobacterium sp.]
MDSTKRTLLIILAAFVLVVAVIAIYVYVGEKPPVATGEIIKLDAVPIHSEMRVGEGAQGVQGGLDTYDQLLVLAQIRVRNQTNIPLFLRDMWADVELNNGDVQRSSAAGKSDFQNVFVAYSQLASLKQDQLQNDITLQPGQTAEGLVIFHYPVTKDQWDARHSFDAAISFRYQKNLLLSWPPKKK